MVINIVNTIPEVKYNKTTNTNTTNGYKSTILRVFNNLAKHNHHVILGVLIELVRLDHHATYIRNLLTMSLSQ